MGLSLSKNPEYSPLEPNENTRLPAERDASLIMLLINSKCSLFVAITDFETIKRSKNYSILNVTIKTGRKNQIRVALANMNHPIIGDKKYGSTKNPLRHMCLHHEKLILVLPDNLQREFYAPIPKYYDFFK